MSSSHMRIFNNRFVVKRKISQGSFGIVFLVLDRQTNQECALKLEKEDNEETKSLDREIQIFEQLQNTFGVPKMIWHGSDNEYNMVVIQLLGRDLAHFFRSYRKFSLKCTTQIAYEAVQVLRNIHQGYVVHRDLKPENMLMSRENDQLYIVDFGISKIYYDGEHMPFRDDKTFMGTTRYASVAAHLGYEISRKDDLESLFYVILYFLKGSLPWQNMPVADNERTKAVGEMKKMMDPHDLCFGQPNELVLIFQYLKSVSFMEEPDYTYILSLLSQIADNNNFVLDQTYDWTDVQPKQPQKQCSLDSRLSEGKSPRQLMKSSSKLSHQMLWQVNEPIQPSNQLLMIPDAHKKPGSSQGIRSEQRHFSNSSSLSNNNMGSYSSMKIKYMPSIVDVNNINKPLNNILNKQQIHYNPESVFNDNMNENQDDSCLSYRMNELDFTCQRINKFKTYQPKDQ